MHHVMEDGCRGTLVRGSRIFKAKRHHSKIEILNLGLECCLFCIFGSHTDLIISAIPIHK